MVTSLALNHKPRESCALTSHNVAPHALLKVRWGFSCVTWWTRDTCHILPLEVERKNFHNNKFLPFMAFYQLRAYSSSNNYWFSRNKQLIFQDPIFNWIMITGELGNIFFCGSTQSKKSTNQNCSPFISTRKTLKFLAMEGQKMSLQSLILAYDIIPIWLL